LENLIEALKKDLHEQELLTFKTKLYLIKCKFLRASSKNCDSKKRQELFRECEKEISNWIPAYQKRFGNDIFECEGKIQFAQLLLLRNQPKKAIELLRESIELSKAMNGKSHKTLLNANAYLLISKANKKKNSK